MADEKIEFGTHIVFRPGPPKPKTKTWFVINKYEQCSIGWIGWFGRWRTYSFYPDPNTVFEKVCLREIAEFCERKTAERRKEKLNEKQTS